jgi:hypothetical protein
MPMLKLAYGTVSIWTQVGDAWGQFVESVYSPGEKHNLMFWGFSRFKNIKNIKKHKVVV